MSPNGKVCEEQQGWTFHIREVSAGVYEATGVDGAGHRVQRRGTDEDLLLAEIRRDALSLLTIKK